MQFRIRLQLLNYSLFLLQFLLLLRLEATRERYMK